MSGTESLMWAVEKDPALRSDFTNVTVLDRPPDDARLHAKVDAAIDAIPRLAQRVVNAPLRLAPPEWREDPTFDLSYHLHRVAAPPPGGTRELLDVAADVAAAPLDRSRPLWEFTVVEGLEGGRAALLQKVHHAVVDGVGGLRLSLSLLDLERAPAAPAAGVDRERDPGEPPLEPDPGPRLAPLRVLSDALAFAAMRPARLATSGGREVAVLARHPSRLPSTAQAAGSLAGSLRRQVVVAERARSPLLATRSLRQRFEVANVSLGELQRIAHEHGCTVNDVFVTGIAGALGRYHTRMGAPVDELRMAMPVNTRDGREGPANAFAPARVVVPTGPKDPAAHLAAVHERLHPLRGEPVLRAADALAAAFALLPTSVLVRATRGQARTVDFTTSNLRGSPVPLYLAGAEILATYPMGPRAGAPLNVTALSYRGELHLGCNTDPAAITDPHALLDCTAEAFGALARC